MQKLTTDNNFKKTVQSVNDQKSRSESIIAKDSRIGQQQFVQKLL